MSTEIRFVVAIALMIFVMVITNIMFPPVVPDTPENAPGGQEPGIESVMPPMGGEGTPVGSLEGLTPSIEEVADAPALADATQVPLNEGPVPEREVRVEGPLVHFTFSNYGARLLSAQLPGFRSMRRPGPVELVSEASSALTHGLIAGSDTLSFASVPFETSATRVVLAEDGPPQRLKFTYEHPSGALSLELEYTFTPGSYVVDVAGRVGGPERPLVTTSLGEGIAFNEADSTAEARMMAYVGNHANEGVRSTLLTKVDEPRVEEGPFMWAAFKSKFFVFAVLAGEEGEEGDYLGGLFVRPTPVEGRTQMTVTHPVGIDGAFDYRLFVGPQDYARLSSIGSDLEDVNPYGWRVLRPVLRPIVSVIMSVLSFLHNTLDIGYGWVLVLFGVLMRVVLWPLNQKAMRAQMRNMAVQPMLQEIQKKYKNNPEQLQKEMMKLYKEYGFNPAAGCLPMLIPFPVLIALFFVFQNTIELRGVPFLWMPDLSAKDPFYLLPLFLAVSMFLMQFITYKSMDQPNPQMKMMMWFMPVFLGFVFMQFASGLNLYYATSNVASIPQQYMIAQERKKAKARGLVKLADRD